MHLYVSNYILNIIFCASVLKTHFFLFLSIRFYLFENLHMFIYSRMVNCESSYISFSCYKNTSIRMRKVLGIFAAINTRSALKISIIVGWKSPFEIEKLGAKYNYELDATSSRTSLRRPALFTQYRGLSMWTLVSRHAKRKTKLIPDFIYIISNTLLEYSSVKCAY